MPEESEKIEVGHNMHGFDFKLQKNKNAEDGPSPTRELSEPIKLENK